ncbi:hypothetical protein [Klebsiella quasipneumoniae]|uniref:hypothetical protein n=1 Tax=Klebsiella quasipneumoniae TaxID=1463165 RepID=UPI00256989BB|nr:hypothetical protein [Klebsiella quasipneumoniae]MDL4071735.1 hypothetical protein [Klebsiella quasipneumoniae]
MAKPTITREQAEEAIDGLEGLISRGVQSVYLDIAIAGLRQLLFAMDQKPALHRYRRKAVEPYGPYPWHYEVFVDYPRPVEGIEDEYFYAAPPVVTGFAVDGEPAENHIGSKNALDAIVSFIKSKSNPTVKYYEEVSEQLFKDNCHGIHSHVIEYILKLGEELEDFRAEQAEMPPAQPVADSEPDRNPVLAYADSYRDMAKQGVESVPIWSIITDLERNIAPLYSHAQPVPVTEREPIAWLNDAYLARGVVDGEAGSEDAGPGYIPVYREAQPAPVVPEDFDFNRFNDVVWLECVASNPHMHSPTTSAIARVALELNKRSATMEAKPVSQNEPISFDEWSRKCALQITLCYPDFREKAKYIWDSARETQQPALVVPDELKEAAADFLTVLDEYPEQLVPINRDSAVVRALRAAMLAAAPQEVKP